MKIAITGATGFMGSHLVEYFLKSGHQVSALARKSSQLNFLEQSGAEIHFGEINDEQSLIKFLKNCDALIHVAGLIKSNETNNYYRVNTEGTKTILKAWAKYASSKNPFIFYSSVAARGPSQSRPGFDSGPVSHYGKSKKAAEEYLISQSYPFPIVILQPPPIYGERDLEFLTLFKMAQWRIFTCITGAKQSLGLIHAHDLCRITEKVLEKASSLHHHTFYLDDGRIYTHDDLMKLISSSVKKRLLRIPLPQFLLFGMAYFYTSIVKRLGKVSLFSPDKVNEMVQINWKHDSSQIWQKLAIQPIKVSENEFPKLYEWYVQEGLIR